MDVALNNEQVVASHTHPVSSQSLHAVSTELTTASDSGNSEKADGVYMVIIDTTSGSDVSHSSQSSCDTVAVHTIKWSFSR